MTSRRPGPLALGAVLAALAMLSACASMSARGAPVSLERAALMMDEAPRAASPAAEPSAVARTSAPGSAQARPATAATGSSDGGQPQSSTPPGTPPERRLRVYSGYLELVVNEVERARAEVIDAAGRAGGYVEETTAEFVVLRVPADRFEAVMDELSGYGELRSRSVETADVTESYAELGRRIEVARRTRERLYALLEEAEDVKERVAILREIRRLTEEIELLRSSLAVLEAQINLSRITVRLRARIDEEAGPVRRIPFPWIASLSPLRPSSRAAAAVLDIEPLPEYAVFEQGKRVRLESADGTRLAVGAVTNQPRGDSSFWREALLHHLGGLYRSAEPVSAGAFQGALLLSKDIQPFQYLVAVIARNDELLLAEAFFPSLEVRRLRLDGILDMLEEVER